ncbi:flavodoxin [Actinokineospora guangxiensis]|uniref:Flavodoxin n=1 Tax=Actinokineospora guangxiensis TaxID=1490288 RepID=A0ABW0EH51_9PSEU
MSRTFVVYESMFGNTRDIAAAVAEGAAEAGPVTFVEVGEAPDRLPDDVGLLFVGGPTHAFGMSRPATRDSARQQAGGPLVSERRGVREWLAGLDGRSKVTAHCFDTRVRVRGLPGSAARGMRRVLRRAGVTTGTAESFWVAGTPGPLVRGEVERARGWARGLAAAHGARTAR